MFMLALFVPALNLLFRYIVLPRGLDHSCRRWSSHQAWHWMEDRWDAFAVLHASITLDHLMRHCLG